MNKNANATNKHLKNTIYAVCNRFKKPFWKIFSRKIVMKISRYFLWSRIMPIYPQSTRNRPQSTHNLLPTYCSVYHRVYPVCTPYLQDKGGKGVERRGVEKSVCERERGGMCVGPNVGQTQQIANILQPLSILQCVLCLQCKDELVCVIWTKRIWRQSCVFLHIKTSQLGLWERTQ